MAKFGLLIDYDLCTGCHTCEVACTIENEYASGRSGMQVFELAQEGPKGPSKRWFAIPNVNCRLCTTRRSNGLLPACVQHCQAKCIKFGTLQELGSEMDKKKILWAP